MNEAETDVEVSVNRDDLAWALKFMSVDGAHTHRVKARLQTIVDEAETSVRKRQIEATEGWIPSHDDQHDGERCMDCASDYIMWWADTPLFLEVIGGHYGPGLLCPTCFDRRARERGIVLQWRPHRWDDDAKALMEADIKAAIESWRQSPEYRDEKAQKR